MASANSDGASANSVPQGVTQNEFKELKRVFEFLADFSPKEKLRRQLHPKVERRQRILAFKANSSTMKIVDEYGHEVSPSVLASELRRLEAELSALQRQLQALNDVAEADKRIHAQDLQLALKFLGKETDKKEAEDMLWEVDENLDGCVDWEEFVLMFRRNIADKTGLEPCRVFNIVQFCMYDRDFTGRISLDETMHMLYARYGKERLESEMKLLFGEKLYTSSNGSLTFLEYLHTIGSKGPAPAIANASSKQS